MTTQNLKKSGVVQVVKQYLDTYNNCTNTVTTFYLVDVNGRIIKDIPRIQFMSHAGVCIDL